MKPETAKRVMGKAVLACVALTVVASLLLWIFRAWFARFPTETF